MTRSLKMHPRALCPHTGRSLPAPTHRAYDAAKRTNTREPASEGARASNANWCRPAVRACPRRAARTFRDLSGSSRQADLTQSRGRGERYHRAHHRGEDVRHPRDDLYHRQPRRRRRKDRRRSGGPRGARRLHAAGGVGLDPLIRAGGDAQARLRSDQGFRADLALGAGAERAGGEPPAAGQQRIRAHCARQGAAGQAQLRFRRPRLDQPFRGRHVRRAGGHPERHRPCPVQGRRAGGDGHHGERGAILFRADRRNGAVHRGGLGQGAGRERRRPDPLPSPMSRP